MRAAVGLAWSFGVALVALGCGPAADPPLSADTPPEPEAASDLVPNAFEISLGRQTTTLGERFALDRSRHVEKTRVEVRGDGERHESVETIDASLRGVGEVVGLDRDGEARSFFYVVEWFTETRGPDQWSLPRGTTIRVVKAPRAIDAVIEVDGRPASERERAAVAGFVDTTSSGTGDADLFGPKTPKRVGEVWSAKTELVREKLAEEGMSVPDHGIRAMARLMGVEPTPDGHRRKVRCQLTIEGFDLSELPAGARVSDASLTSSVDMVLAPDGFVLERASRRATRVTVTMERPGEAPRSLELSDTMTYESHNRPL